MANLKEIKERIESLKKTTKVTSTMKIVATTQFKKWQRRKPFDFLEGFMSFPMPISFEGHIDYTIGIASDRGLCGAYNNNIKKILLAGKPSFLIAIGQKLFGISNSITQITMPKDDFFASAYAVIDQLKSARSIKIVYTHYINPVVHEVRTLYLSNNSANQQNHFILLEGFCEDQREQFFKDMLATYICYAMSHASMSENAMRMIAMESATKNGEDLLDKLSLEYNKVRQGNITREVSEIGASVTL